jgi:uncharacterized Zn finger protein
MAAPMTQTEPEPAPKPSKPVMSNCPDCSATLAVFRIIPGRAGAEYWTMRCTRCGGIHLDIVQAAAPAPAPAVQDSGELHV